MKKTILIFLAFVVLILAAAAILPVVYKDDVARIVKQEINKNVNAKVDFSDISLSLFHSFPHFSLGINDLSVTGEGVFKYDTLAAVPSFRATIDLLSVIKKEPLQVIKIDLEDPYIHIVVLEDGSANYDIMAETEEIPGEVDTVKASDEVIVQMQQVKITNAHLVYDDSSLPAYFELRELNHVLKGDLTKTSTLLNTFTSAGKVKVVYDSVEYLSEARAEIDANLNVNFNTMRFDISDNSILVNEIPLEAEGFFHMLDDSYKMDISFASSNKSFKPLLSMVPAIYMEGYEELKTDGSLNLSGWVRGTYSETETPGYHMDMIVQNGMFQYPDLPSKIEDITIKATLHNPSGITDQLELQVDNFSFLLAGSQFNASLLLKTPISDPYIKSRISGAVDLSKVADVYPLDRGTQLTGQVELDANLDGHISSIENESFDKFKALGYVLVENMMYRDDAYDVEVQRGQFNLSPEYIDMAALNIRIGGSDVFADGKLRNGLSYFMDDGVLRGELNVRSRKLDLNELMVTSEEPDQEESDGGLEAVVVPKDIDFTMTASIDQLIYSNITMNDLVGEVVVKDGAVNLNDVSTSTFGGAMSLNGYYKNNGNEKPVMDMTFDMKEVSVSKAAVAFVSISKYAPILRKANGTISSRFSLNTRLTNQMQPVFESLNGNGFFEGETLSFGDVNTLEKLGDELRINELKNAQIKNVDISFEISNGKMFVKPFTMKLNGMDATLGGSTGLDQSIDYLLELKIPRAKLGTDINDVLNSLSGKVKELGVDFDPGQVINLNAKITGTLSNPKITPTLGDAEGGLKENLEKEIDQKIEEEKEKLQQKAEKEAMKRIEQAQKKADELLAEARNKAQKIRDEAEQAAQKIRENTDSEAEKLISEAKGKGALAKIAAEKAAKEVRKAGYNKADKLVDEADKQAQKVIEAARKQGEKLIENAKNSADKIEP